MPGLKKRSPWRCPFNETLFARVLSRFMAQSEFMVFLGYERSEVDNGAEFLVHVTVFPNAIYILGAISNQMAAKSSSSIT